MRVKPKNIDISAQSIPPVLRRIVAKRVEIELDYGDRIYHLISTRGETLRITQEEYYAVRPGDIFPSWNWAELPIEEVCLSAVDAATEFAKDHPSIRGRQ